jgi:hypothetical protein
MIIPKPKSGDPRIQKILDVKDINYEVDGDGDYKVIFDLGNGRSQVAFINSNVEEFAGCEIREIWSPGLVGDGELSQRVANELLSRNHQYKLGSWSTMKSGGSIAAVFKVAVDANATPDELITCLSVVLRVADDIEKEFLQGSDNL